MPTKTPRERFEEEFGYIFDTNDMSAKPINEKLWSHIETLLEEDRQETKSKIKKYIDENRVVLNSNDIFSVRCEKEATNSTLDDLEYFTSSL